MDERVKRLIEGREKFLAAVALCGNCGHARKDHTDDKCLFAATSYSPMGLVEHDERRIRVTAINWTITF